MYYNYTQVALVAAGSSISTSLLQSIICSFDCYFCNFKVHTHTHTVWLAVWANNDLDLAWSAYDVVS